jgi:DNA invertase Pin-like site-specific DNA recombinase
MARTRVVAYVRVSAAAQAEGGVSLAAQRAKVAAYAEAFDLDLMEVVEDAAESAKSLDRPGLRRALALLEGGGAEALLVTKLDRLSRSVVDMDALIRTYFGEHARHPATLLSVGDHIDTRTAAGRLVLNVLVSVAQWERERCGERTREALAHLKTEGVRLGGAALGWTRTEETDEGGRRATAEVGDEAETVERILGLRDEGRGYREIAAVLAAEGRRTKSGGRWHHETIRRVVARATA